MIQIKILIENTVFQPDVCAEHGLAIYLKTRDHTLLFDAGQTEGFLRNSSVFGTPLEEIEKIIISHGHYDHCGGLLPLLEKNTRAEVYCKEEALIPKFSDTYQEKRQINLPLIHAYKKHPSRFCFVKENHELFPGVWIISHIIQKTKFENDDAKLYCLSENQFIKDPFDDEIFLLIEDDNQLHLITGCSHRGIINMIHTATMLFPGKSIKSVTGGFHLRNKDEQRIQLVAKYLNESQIEQINVCHCTGIEEYLVIKKIFRGKTSYLSTGMLVKL